MGQKSGSQTPPYKDGRGKMEFHAQEADDFVTLFKPLVQRGLPLFWEEKEPMFSQKEYYDILVEFRKDRGQKIVW